MGLFKEFFAMKRNRQVCLGRLDEKSGEVIPSFRREGSVAAKVGIKISESRVISSQLIIDKVANDTGLLQTVRKSFGIEMGNYVLSLAYFVVQKGLALSRSDRRVYCYLVENLFKVRKSPYSGVLYLNLRFV
jgi:hypothetical protein